MRCDSCSTDGWVRRSRDQLSSWKNSKLSKEIGAQLINQAYDANEWCKRNEMEMLVAGREQENECGAKYKSTCTWMHAFYLSFLCYLQFVMSTPFPVHFNCSDSDFNAFFFRLLIRVMCGVCFVIFMVWCVVFCVAERPHRRQLDFHSAKGVQGNASINESMEINKTQRPHFIVWLRHITCND